MSQANPHEVRDYLRRKLSGVLAEIHIYEQGIDPRTSDPLIVQSFADMFLTVRERQLAESGQSDSVI